MSAETAAILDKAADIIERNGWRQGPRPEAAPKKRADQYPVDAWDALVLAACKATTARSNKELQLVIPAGRALARFLRLSSIATPGAWTIPDWNDHPGRTAEQVIAALRGAAQAERERAS